MNCVALKHHAKHFSRGFALLLLCCMSALPSWAQTVEEQQLFKRFEKMFNMLDSLVFQQDIQVSQEELRRADYITNDSASRSSLELMMDEKLALEIKSMKAESGLIFTGQTYYRLDEGVGITEDDDAVSRYKAKIQAELRWNFLSSSIINRKSRTKELELKSALEELSLESKHIDRQIDRQKEYLQKEYDSLFSAVLKLRINNLQLLNDAQQYLVQDRSISTDELLKIMDEQAIAERLYAAIPHEYEHEVQLSNPYGSTIKIDTAALMEHVRMHETNLMGAELQMQLLQQQIKHTNYWRSLNLSPFIRYSYYMRPVLNNSANVDAGVAFQIPITGEMAHKKKVLKAEVSQTALSKDLMMDYIHEEIRILLLEIERANRGLAGEVSRIGKLKKYMALRKENYKGHIGEYNFMSRLMEYNHYLKCWENFYTYQYKRDCCIADLQRFLSNKSILEFCTITYLDL